jgi:hypothetical protein
MNPEKQMVWPNHIDRHNIFCDRLTRNKKPRFFKKTGYLTAGTFLPPE